MAQHHRLSVATEVAVQVSLSLFSIKTTVEALCTQNTVYVSKYSVLLSS